MSKGLKYYMALPYRIEITPIPEEEGGGYAACIPELGRYAFIADGESADEAISNLMELKEVLFDEYLTNGKEIPKPVEMDLEKYSGKFVTRLPKYLHQELVLQAKLNNTSLNTWVTTLLSAGLVMKKWDHELMECACKFQGELWKAAQAGAMYFYDYKSSQNWIGETNYTLNPRRLHKEAA